MRASIQSSYFFLSMLLLAACETQISHTNDLVGDPNSDDPELFDQFTVDLGNRKMDILFVIDNSGSMGDQQAILTQSFSDFIASFVDRQIDYHIGVITTDNRLANDSVWTTGWGSRFFNNGPSSLLWSVNNVAAGDPVVAPANKFLDRSMGAQAVVDTFKKNASLGSDGSGDEASLLSVTRFLSAEKQTGWNEGFLRPTSLFSTVIVSDEDESRTTCTVDPSLPNSACDLSSGRPSGNSYVFADADAKAARLQGFRNSFKAQRPDRPSLLRLDAVIVKPTTDGSRYDASCVASGERDGSQGKAYAEIVNEFGGSLSSICGNFAPDIGALGSAISSSIEKEFALSATQVNAATVAVEVNGNALASDQFSYDPQTNHVKLSDAFVATLDLLAGSVLVKVRYHKKIVTIN